MILGIGVNQAYQWAEKGVLPNIRPGKRIIIPRAALTKMLASAESK